MTALLAASCQVAHPAAWWIRDSAIGIGLAALLVSFYWVANEFWKGRRP